MSLLMWKSFARLCLWTGWIACLALVTGCGGGSAEPSQPGAPVRSSERTETPRKPTPLVFRAQELDFVYERGESGQAWPSETTGGGVGMIDYDGDGDLDLFFAQGVPLPVGSSKSPPSDVLLQNQGGGVFRDVSAHVGLSSKGYGQGVAIADYDADGDPDVYVTRYGANTLWRNDAGHFSDVTEAAGVGCPLWSLGAAFADYDGDGDLDLFVANYFAFQPSEAPFARDPITGKPNYGMPSKFDGEPDVLYENLGDGRFKDVTQKAGIAGKGRGMGVVATDLDDDGRVDFLVANDAEANAFWQNRGDGTFEDRAESIGLAYNGEGQPEANMGIAVGDSNGDLLDDVVMTHFFNEHDTIWRALKDPHGGVLFQDQTREAGIANDTKPLTTWGVAFADFDQDGGLDLVATAGHIREEPTQRYTYANPPILWRRNAGDPFENVTRTAGAYFQEPHLGRGLAVGDLDIDGDLDLVIVHHHAKSVVLWNETPRAGGFLSLRLRGRKPNIDAVGARVTLQAGPLRMVRAVIGGGSYLSSHDPRVHFGLGDAAVVDRVEVRWPSGRVETLQKVSANQVIECTEGEVPKFR